MVKDSKRFADSGGWGWGAFEYDAASDTFRPATVADNPPQENDAKCGFACHTLVQNRDYVFTEYRKEVTGRPQLLTWSGSVPENGGTVMSRAGLAVQ